MNPYDEKFQRNPLTAAQQEKVRRARFAIVGLGGTGGFILENLIRLGAEDFIVFDHDRFELSNFNRQTLATDEFLDLPKVHAAVARAKSVNKNIRIETHDRFDSAIEVRDMELLVRSVQVVVRQAEAHHDGRYLQRLFKGRHDRDRPPRADEDGVLAEDLFHRS